MTGPARRLIPALTAPALTALALTTQPLAAQDAQGQTGWGSLDTATVATGITRVMLSYLRLTAEVRYASLEPDRLGRGFVLRDLHVAGIGPASDCRVTIGRAGVSGLAILPAERSTARLDLADLAIATACFGDSAQAVAYVAGGDMLRLSSVALETTAEAGSSAVMVDLRATAPDLARIEASGDFDYLAITSPAMILAFLEGMEGVESGVDTTGDDPAPEDGTDDTDPPPVPSVGVQATLRAAHVTVEDLGGWGRIEPMMTGGMKLQPAMLDGLASAEPGTPVREFQDRLVVALKAFVAQPGRITAQLRPEAPLRFETTAWRTPDDALAVLMPGFTNAPPPPSVVLLPDAAANPTDEGAKALGLALARGEGVPRNDRRAIELLTPLQDDGEVALALSELTLGADPAAAYTHALRAAAAGTAGALSALDRAEARLPLGAVLGAQLPSSTALPDTAFASVESLRDAALGYEQGDGAPRSYALAWRMGTLAAATGDGAARALIDRLEARFGADPAWRDARDAAADRAAQDWDARGLARSLAGG